MDDFFDIKTVIKGLEHSEERHHRIESIPGKLGVHTKDEDRGQSKYGILQMQWTTAVPVPVTRDYHPHCYSPVSDDTSICCSNGKTSPSKSRLPSIIQKYGSSVSQHMPIVNDSTPPMHCDKYSSPDYAWEYPIAPPPAKESRISIPYIKKEHENYCKYYTLVKKKMQNYTSKTQGNKVLKPLPQVEIKKAIPERLKIPDDIPNRPRVPSVLLPPITLNQLISART